MPNNADPRFKNELPQAQTVSEYARAYAERLSSAIQSVPAAPLERAYALLGDAVRNGKRVYVAGNGGSAAIADHLCCDWTKGTHVQGKPALKTHSLAAPTGLLTALANDFSYEQIFEKQLEMYAEAGDVVVLISSSGNSPNVVRAAESARAKNIAVIGMTGFSGGKLKELSDVSLHVSANNYGVVEDAHQALMHALAQFFARERDSKA